MDVDETVEELEAGEVGEEDVETIEDAIKVTEGEESNGQNDDAPVGTSSEQTVWRRLLTSYESKVFLPHSRLTSRIAGRLSYNVIYALHSTI
jgi:hypothetical protein